MNPISPRSSEVLAGSSLAFVKPMPKRGDDPRAGQGDSAEFDVGMLTTSDNSPESALTLWRQLHHDADDLSVSPLSDAGLMLGHFQVEEQIGRGGMGAVFRAKDLRLDREVAIKVLAGPLSTDPSAVERFRNEARAAARLDHDNVARVFFVGEDHGLHFIAFEFIHGANIRELIEARGVLSPAETVNYGLQIASALRHVSAAGVVHRDVKPSNIIVTPTGRAKLVDLGLARKHDPEASKDLTVDGTTLGTFDYISPEQAKDPRKVDIRSDIYSLGCTLFHMLTGEPPYPQGTMLQKLLDHQGKDVPHAATINPNTPPELSAVVRKMMASDPPERYANADELIGDLQILAHAYGLRPAAPGSVVWVPPQRPDAWTLLRRHRVWIATAVALMFAVFAIDRVQSWTAAPSRRDDITSDTTASQPSISQQPTSPAGTHQADSSPASASLATGDVREAGDRNDTSPNSENESRIQSPRDAQPTLADSDPSNRPPSMNVADSTERSTLTGIQVPLPDAIFSPFQMPFASIGESGVTGSPTPIDTSPMAPSLPSLDSPSTSSTVTPVEKPPVDATLPTEPFLVQVSGGDHVGYATLEAACTAAEDGGVVILNFDGPSKEPQRPLRIADKRLRIRRGANRRPVIQFAVPDHWQRAEIVRMISVSRGSLELYDIDFVVNVDASFVTDGWVLLSLSAADEVILRGVSATVKNTGRYPAAIVEITQPTVPAFGDVMPDAMVKPPLKFEAEDCFFRGQADLFKIKSADPARVRLSNVAVAVDGSLVNLTGTDSIDVRTDINDEHQINMELRHVTTLTGAELVRFDVTTGFSVPQLVVNANDSVFVVESGQPLISMQGDYDLFDFQLLLEWTGSNSFLETQDPVWAMSSLSDERDYDLSEWNDLWKQSRLIRPSGTNLLRRDRSQPDHLMTADDLQLVVKSSASNADDGSPDVINPAIDGASDGTDAGVPWSSTRVPKLTVVELDRRLDTDE